MLIRPLSDDRLVDAYGIRYHQMYPDGGDHLADWGFGRAVVAPGQCTDPHSHSENEVFVIVRGTARMRIGSDTEPLEAGQYVLIPAGQEHDIRNVDDAQPLEFLSIYWPPGLGDINL
jgi:mannose-6-phosphate isomerase-like protein (cupin superfamily)